MVKQQRNLKDAMHSSEEVRVAGDNLVLGIIGGSGIYDIDGVENGKWVKVTTPW